MERAAGHRHGPRPALIAVGTVAAVALAAALVTLADEKMRFVVHVEDGFLEVSKQRALRRTEVETFGLREITEISVDGHGDDRLATYVHTTKKRKAAVFVTVLGDDARRVETFLVEGIAAWRALHTESE